VKSGSALTENLASLPAMLRFCSEAENLVVAAASKKQRTKSRYSAPGEENLCDKVCCNIALAFAARNRKPKPRVARQHALFAKPSATVIEELYGITLSSEARYAADI